MKLSGPNAVGDSDISSFYCRENNMAKEYKYEPPTIYAGIEAFFADYSRYPKEDALERLVTRLHPIKNLSVPTRYVISTILVAVNLYFHLITIDAFLFFFPSIIVSALFFNRGTGIYAAFLSGILAYVFLLEPGSPRLLGLFGITIVGAFIAIIIESLRRSLDRQKSAFKDLRESETKYRAILETATEAIITSDTKGVIRSINPATEKIFGYCAEEVIGRQAWFLLAPEEAETLKQYLDDYLRTGRKRIIGIGREIVGIRKDGTKVPLFLSMADWHDANGTKFFTSIMRDISEEKIERERIRHYMRELEDSNQRLDDFVYVVSHDLKEPVRGILNFSRFLLQDYGKQLDKEGVKQLEMLKVMARRMQEMITDLLHFAIISRERLSFEDVNVSEIAQEIIELQQIHFQTENADIKIQDNLPSITANKTQITEVFRNLIVNAVKYNEEAEKIIEVGCLTNHPRKPNHPVFFIKDNGIGIELKHQKDIFKMFKRLHAHEAYGGGTGSGLAICKRIIDQHNGEIWVEAANGKGSIFYFYVDPKQEEFDIENTEAWRARQDSNLQPTA